MTGTSDSDSTISAGLRSATAVAHDRAERSTFVADLMSGHLDADSYARLAAQLYFVYRALEETGDALGGDAATAPAVAGILDERLRRLPRLTADLAALGVDPAGVSPLPSVTSYVEAIESSRTDPARFVAHHYTRYLGDLSGGQVIRSRMKLHYGLTDETLSFYVFDDIEKLKRFKDDYRVALDALPFDEEARERLLDEAVRAFEFNEALFADLDGGQSAA